MIYFQKQYTKRELLSYAGNIEQLAGVTRKQISEGNGDGIRLFDVRNGSGLEFSVLEGKCMDLFSASYKGYPLNFVSKNGLVSPMRFVPQSGEESMRCISGGLLYTCGTANVGYACRDGDEQLVLHGRLRAMAAANTMAEAHWTEDDYIIELHGEMRETALFGENIAFRRKIWTRMGRPVIYLEDEIENEGFREQPFMLMYHINFGFPFVDQGIRIFTAPAEITCRDPWTIPHIPEYERMEGPDPFGQEQYLTHTFKNTGAVMTAAYNETLGIGVYLKQNTEIMPFLHEWKTNVAGDYALGLEPANCHCEGRVLEREKYHTLRTLSPFEKAQVNLEIGILEGREQLMDILKNQ